MYWKTQLILFSWLRRKPADLDLLCLKKKMNLGSAGQGLICLYEHLYVSSMLINSLTVSISHCLIPIALYKMPYSCINPYPHSYLKPFSVEIKASSNFEGHRLFEHGFVACMALHGKALLPRMAILSILLFFKILYSEITLYRN